MRIVFASNFLNHHQLPICNEFHKAAEEFYFVATEQVTKERIDLGYHDYNIEIPYVIRAYENNEQYIHSKQLIDKADIVIWGSAPFELVQDRIGKNKLTFRYSERIFRQGYLTLLKKRNRDTYYNLYTKYSEKNYYLLCTGSFTAKDYNRIKAFPGKKMKWGYFPPVDTDRYEEIVSLKKKNEIIWCGRFIQLKHPESMIVLAEYLRAVNASFHITMVGDGILLDSIKKTIIKKNLQEYISLIGAVDADDVRQYMKRSTVFAFTSDKREGWGAVLNEAMNSACVPIVSFDIGSAKYLVQHGKNGYLFKSQNWKEMSSYIKELISNPSLLELMAQRSYNVIMNTWNARVAAQNLLDVSHSILNGEGLPNKVGPCEKEI